MMNQNQSEKHLGVVVCKHCGTLLDTLDTDGINVFYGACESNSCETEQNDK
jgi:hypothetical protein